MNKRYFLILGILIGISTTSLIACDVCGCSPSNLGIGLLNNYRCNSISLNYFNTRFTSDPSNSVRVNDRFTQVEIALRYFIGNNQRWNLSANLPYQVNTRSISESTITVSGFSDLRFNVNYAILDNREVGEKGQIYLEAGGGIVLPTGKYDANIHDLEIPENFNLGNGSLGYLIQLNSVVNYNSFGLVVNGNYQYQGKTDNGYQFGSKFNSQLTAFKRITTRDFDLIPSLAIGSEYLNNDTYANGNKVDGTGGNGVFLIPGITCNLEKWIASIGYSLPIIADYSDGLVIAKGRLTASFSLTF